MRSVLPALVAGSVLVLTAACGNNAAAPAATPEIAVSTPSPSPAAPPMPAELTKAEFGPKVLAALRAAGTFQATAEMTGDERGPSARVTAAIRLKGGTPDAVVTSEDGLPVTRIGKVLYMKNHELTGNPKKPWVRLDLGTKDPEVLIAAVVVVQDLNRAMVHQLIGGAAYATSFKVGGVQSLDGTQVREYVVSIDVKKATAVRALGVYLDRTDAKTLPAQLSVTITIDAQNRPRRMSFVLADTKDGSTAVRAWFEQFGAKLPIVAPPTAQTGKLDLS